MLDLRHQISLGDVQSNYLLTTAENELGVVVAHSESGNLMQQGFLPVFPLDSIMMLRIFVVPYVITVGRYCIFFLFFFFFESWEGLLLKAVVIYPSCLPWSILIFVPFYVSGAQMVPISWCEMQCPLTHAKEFRKVARVQPEYLQAWEPRKRLFWHKEHTASPPSLSHQAAQYFFVPGQKHSRQYSNSQGRDMSLFFFQKLSGVNWIKVHLHGYGEKHQNFRPSQTFSQGSGVLSILMWWHIIRTLKVKQPEQIAE